MMRIAHSRLIFGRHFLNRERFNYFVDYIEMVMLIYEVGIALACRPPSDVLLVRDDHDKFLFDVSTVPHVTLDFTNASNAIQTLTEHLLARLREQIFLNDARVQITISSLSAEEVILLKQMKDYTINTVWAKRLRGSPIGMLWLPPDY